MKTPPSDQITRLEFLRQVSSRGLSQTRRHQLQCAHRYSFDGHQCVSTAVAHVTHCKCGVIDMPLCTVHYNKHLTGHATGFDGVWVGWTLHDQHRKMLELLELEVQGVPSPDVAFEKWEGGIPPREEA